MSVYDWNTKLAEGKQGEEVVKAWLGWRHPGATLQDVREDPRFQARDIDFVGDSITYEVKTDLKAHKTGNLFLELDALAKSDADYWLFYLPQRHWLLMAPRARLETLALSRADEQRRVLTQSASGSMWAVYGVPLRISEVLLLVPCTLYTEVGGSYEQSA